MLLGICSRGKDVIIGMSQWVCLVGRGGRRAGKRLGGRICCEWMVQMALFGRSTLLGGLVLYWMLDLEQIVFVVVDVHVVLSRLYCQQHHENYKWSLDQFL
jgi:hypothetical protein